jgi:trehalose-phosphatase
MVTTTRFSQNSSSIPRTLNSATKALQPRPSRKPQCLFDGWKNIKRRIDRADNVIVFLDFDGTLVRLRRNPKEVFLDDKMRRVLCRLVRHRRVTLCFISGRRLGDLRRRVAVEGALYFGLHGWERSNGQASDTPRARRIRKEMRWMQRQTRNLSGIKVDDKGICFAIHYRTARKPVVEKTRALVEGVLDRLGPNFSLMAGKKIWELYPKDMGSKGKAARELLRNVRSPKLAIYAGDDTTDETAFALLRNAVTIRVGKFRETKAKYSLRSPAEVLKFIEKLEEALT